MKIPPLIIIHFVLFPLQNLNPEQKGRELRALVAAPGRGLPQEHNSRARWARTVGWS